MSISFVRSFIRQPVWFQISLTAVVALAIILRLYPGRDHIIWNNNDFGRDEYVVREMVARRDFIKLIGPRSEVYSFRHQDYLVNAGPLYYYFIAPWYALGHGDPNITVIAFLLLHVSGMIPLGLLAHRLFRTRIAVILTVLFFAIAYEQIEYSRWLLNPVMAIPFLAWVYYFLWEVISSPTKLKAALLGVSIGLAIQAEVFLGYWLPVTGAVFLITKQKRSHWLSFIAGLTAAVSTFIISELKFHFRMTESIIFDFLLLPLYRQNRGGSKILDEWSTHWGLVAKHVFFNTHFVIAFAAFVLILVAVLLIALRHKRYRREVAFLMIITWAPAIIYAANFVNKAYVDLGTGVSFILVTVFFLEFLRRCTYRWFVPLFVALVVISQLQLLQTNVAAHTPYGRYSFLTSENILFSEKMEVVDAIYQEVGDRPFTISVMDAPYGFPAMWGSVFEQYARRNHVAMPQWYGWFARGTPGENVFQVAGVPNAVHVAFGPKERSVDKTTEFLFYQQQNELTKINKKMEKNDYVIEFRSRTK